MKDSNLLHTVQHKSMKQQSTALRAKWTAAEVKALTDVVTQMGDNLSWSEVAQRLGGGRTAKQCRFRWLNQSNENTKTGGWDHLEEFIIASEHAIRGPCWARTARLLPGRHENGCKNRWNGIYRSRTLYRPCSVLWHYVHQMSEGLQPTRAFSAAVEAWSQVVPGELAASVIQEFKEWQVNHQPGGIAVQLPSVATHSGESSLSTINLEHFKPETRYHPDAIASMKVSLREAVTQLLSPNPNPTAAGPSAAPQDRGHIATSSAAIQLPSQLRAPRYEGLIGSSTDQSSCPASPASMAPTTNFHSVGHIQGLDATSSGHMTLHGATIQQPQLLHTGQVMMAGQQVYRVVQAVNMDSLGSEHMQLASGMELAGPGMMALPASDASGLPLSQMLGLRSRASLTQSQAFNARQPEAVQVIDLRDTYMMNMGRAVQEQQQQQAAMDAASTWHTVGPAMSAATSMVIREVAVPPPEAATSWAPSEVPQAYLAPPPAQYAAAGGSRMMLYQPQAQPGVFFISAAP